MSNSLSGSTNTRLAFTDIARRIRHLDLPTVDAVIGIAIGGIVPASLVAYQLDVPLGILQINYRDLNNDPRYEEPQLLGQDNLPSQPSRILLVDDVAVTGQTLQVATKALAGHDLTTLVLKGQADIVIFAEINTCVDWPWKV